MPLFKASGIIGSQPEDESTDVKKIVADKIAKQKAEGMKSLQSYIDGFTPEKPSPKVEEPEEPAQPEKKTLNLEGLDYMTNEDYNNAIADEMAKQEEKVRTPEVDPASVIAMDTIKEFEQFREDAYYATDLEEEEGIVTIGYGTTNLVNPELKIGDKMTQKEAEKQLAKRLITIQDEIKTIEEESGTEFSENQSGALQSLLYNIGTGRLWRGSNARRLLIEGDIEGFKREAFDAELGFVKEKKGAEPLAGLVRRRAKELEIFNTGVDEAS